MIFTSFEQLKIRFGVDRPSLAPEGLLYWSKLYPHILENDKRKGRFTTIRIKRDWSYTVGRVIPIYLDEEKPNMQLFDAKVLSIKTLKKIDITDKIAKGDADMTVKEFWDLLDFFYKKKHGNDPELEMITMRKV